MVPGRWISRVGAVIAVAACVAACGGGSNFTPPNEVAVNYAYDLAEGSFGGACAQLDRSARASIEHSTRISCARLFAHCLPTQASRINHDQAQLLYANVTLTMHGQNRADAVLSGTTVAKGIREVSLVEQRGVWRLTSYGRNIRRCTVRTERERRDRGHKHTRQHSG
jgi:hypothetical protein